MRNLDSVGGSVVVAVQQEQLPPARRSSKGKANRHDAPRNPDADKQALARALERQAERHRLYQRMVEGLALSEEDRQKLRARGLSDEQIDRLEAQGVRSLVPGLYPGAAGAPGFESDGRYRGKSGFLIPAIGRAPDGTPELRGFQLATAEEERGEGGKYIWLSKGREREAEDVLRVVEVQADGSSTVDQSPLFQFAPEGQLEKAVLTDGALKAALTAARQGVAGFGSPGFNYASSMGQLLASLRRLQLENAQLRIVLAPDAGDLENANILRSLLTVTQALQREGLSVSWLDLQQERGKEGGIDVDEANALAELEVEPNALLQRADAAAVNTASRGIDLGEMGFHPPEPGEKVELPFDLSEVRRYPAGQRLEAVEQALAEGFTQVVLTDPPGSGKSHWSAHLGPEDLERLGVKRVIVASNRHFEQGEEFDLPTLRGRGSGLKRTSEGVLRAMKFGERLGPGEQQVAGPNCKYLEQLDRYQARNLELVSSLCSECSWRSTCESVPGGFRHDRGVALQHPVCVAHPKSLQGNLLLTAAEEDDGPQLPVTGLIFDDVGPAAFIESLSVGLASIETLLASSAIRKLSKVLQEPLQVIHGLVAGSSRITKGESKNLSPLQFEQALAPLALDEASLRKVSWSELQEVEATLVNRHPEHRVCWLEVFRQWLRGEAVGWVHNGELHFSYWEDRLRGALAQARWIVWADATALPDDVAGLIRRANERHEDVRQRICVLREDRALVGADLKVRQVYGLGSLGYSRSSLQSYWLHITLGALMHRGLVKTETTAVIDTLAGLEQGSGQIGAVQLGWMSGSRGSNRAQHLKQLVMIGSPRPNLAAAAARFQLLYGTAVDLSQRTRVSYEVLQMAGSPMVLRVMSSVDQRFRRYYCSLMQAEIEQGLGRLRAYRREGQQLEAWVLGDAPVPFPVELVPLEEVVGASVVEQGARCTQPALKAAAAGLTSKGQEPSAAAIAEAMGLPVALVCCRLASLHYPSWSTYRQEDDAREIAKERSVDTAA